MTPLMSFWPSIFDKIVNQIKLIEYRRTFPKECSYAYMYVSKPVKAVSAIIYFGQKHALTDWKLEYSNDVSVSERIDQYLSDYRYGMEIIGVQKIKPISLEDLRANVNRFVAPQSYLLLENNQELRNYLEKHTVKVGELIRNDLTNAFPEHVCKRY